MKKSDMYDVELIIKIPKDEYEHIKKDIELMESKFIPVPSLYKIVANGTQVPKGHGRVVDVGKIDKDRIDHDNPIIYLTVNGEYIEAVSLDYINNLTTIIEADKESEDIKNADSN